MNSCPCNAADAAALQHMISCAAHRVAGVWMLGYGLVPRCAWYAYLAVLLNFYEAASLLSLLVHDLCTSAYDMLPATGIFASTPVCGCITPLAK
jgi:hypothetical protein